jgi:hemoglobin/transferrin/lactoferrin receptor protein
VVSAVRYDHYELKGGGVTSEGSRVSPKITVGITPAPWITPYFTYAEGYRAPAITETLVNGSHPVFPQFDLLPNPDLKPEVGKNKEVGVNIRFNDILKPGDAFRAKANVYRNDVDDFIEFTLVNFGQTGAGGYTCTAMLTLPFPPFPTFPGFCEQYQNIPHARLEGLELESNYDAGDWFAGLNYSHVRGRNVDTGEPLAKIPPDFVMTTLGARFLDRKLTVAVRWQAVAAKNLDQIPLSDGTPAVPVFPPTGSYNLVNLYAGYQPNPDILASFTIENLLNEQYSRYMTYFPNASGTGFPNAFPQAGITFKGALKVRFSDDLFKGVSNGLFKKG